MFETEIPELTNGYNLEMTPSMRGAFVVEINQNGVRKYSGKIVLW